MAELFILVLFSAAVAIAHFSVRFIEPRKASLWKAVGVVLAFMVFNNLAQRYLPPLPSVLHWILYIAFTTFLVWILFRLKPIHNFTVAACYVVGRWALMYAVSLLPLEVLNA